MNSKLIVFLFLFLSSYSFSEKTQRVQSVKGEAIIIGDVSPNKAKIMALNDAKINALKTAGIAENIKSYQLLFTSQQNNDYSQFFNSDIQTEIQGGVKDYSIISERIYCKNEFEIIYEIIIDATVIKYDTKPDIGFDFYVDGVKPAYSNDDKLTFSIRGTQEGYITIFNITDTDASLLFPNPYEKNQKVNTTATINFPTVKIDYTLHTEMKVSETNRLIIVYTKAPLQFIKMDKNQVTTQEQIFSWIYSIPPDQRKVEYKTLIINK